MLFGEWVSIDDNWCLVDVRNNAEEIWDAAVRETAKRCKEIAQQRYLAENQAVEIDKTISSESGV